MSILAPIIESRTLKYKITGMTCGGCAAKVQATLEAITEISSAVVDKPSDSASLVFNQELSINRLNNILKGLDAKYGITNLDQSIEEPAAKSWFQSYKPILLVFFFILLVTLLIQFNTDRFNLQEWMRHFMAGFFLVFSFFKMMDLSGFAKSYSGYDIIAKRWTGWGYVYAFIELGLGISFLINCCPLATNLFACTVMTISIIGVLQSVFKKQKIQCACLGAIFDLPMSTVTIIEDALMITMSGYMIFSLTT